MMVHVTNREIIYHTAHAQTEGNMIACAALMLMNSQNMVMAGLTSKLLHIVWTRCWPVGFSTGLAETRSMKAKCK